MKKGLSIFLIFGRSICYLLFLMSALILSSCSGDGDRSPDSDELTVTGIEDDTTTRKSKTWKWGCRENNTSADCDYRYAINKSSSHTFSSSDNYGNKTEVTTEDGLDGKYYIHVQAESDDTDEESSVASASVTLDNTLPEDPDPSDFKAPSPSDTIPTKVTVEELEAGDVVHVYVVGGPDDEDDTENSNFLKSAWNVIASTASLTSAATTTTIVTSSNVCADDDNEVGMGTVARGKTEVTVDVSTKKGEHEYYATITDEAGNKSACIKVFTYENTAVPTPPAPTACPSIKPLPHWKFVEGLCRPSCGSIAGHAGYGGLGPDGTAGTADDPHVYSTKAETCSALEAKENDDWEKFSIEDGGRTISSNEAHEVAERGGVCCKRGSVNNAIAAPEVEDIEPDSTPRLSKSFTWSCDRSNGCRYRYTINEFSSHVFPEDEAYTNTTTITKDGVTRRTKYYLHVQAAAGSRESEVKSVSFILSAPTPPRVTGLANDSVPKASKTWNWGCNKGSCTYRFAVNKSQTHQFDNNDSYTSTRTATKTITSASDNGTYYLHIQVKDADDNESEIFKFLAVLEVAGTGGDVEVTGLSHDTNGGQSKKWDWGCNKSSCTYRHVINTDQNHDFTNEDLYNSTKTATKTITTASDSGTYYLHVQAKDSNNNASDVETVLVVLNVSVVIQTVYVTGLSHDDTPKRSKTWTWGCNRSPCTYRHAINQTQTYTFSRGSYTSTKTATKAITSASDNGIYYVHVQAKDANNNESNVKTVIAVLEVPITLSDVQVTGLSHDTNAGRSKTWTWGCNKNSCTYRYVINKNQSHTFSGSYGSTRTTSKTISSASDNATYYLHVQAKDSNNNVSDVKTVLAVLEVPTTAVDVNVTGLSHDDTPKRSKTWTWNCDRGPCTYRYAVNQSQSHTFSGSYRSTKTATKAISSASENGIYYLHVQAKDANNNESNVKTVIAVLEVPITLSDVQVTGLSHDTNAGRSKTWTWGCNKNSCTYRYVINKNQSHTFSGSYGSTRTTSKTISSASDNGTYYLHVQAKDSNNNASDVKTVLTVLEVPTTAVDVNVTGLSHDDVPRASKTWTWNCDRGPCTYRYAVNQSQSHTFSGSYRSTRTTTRAITSASENGIYYLHVQARDSNNNVSEVETVIAVLEISTTSSDVRVTGLSHDTNPKSAKTWNWGCNKSSCTYRYTVNQSQSHTFSTNYGSRSTATRRITSSSQNGTYYLHVQARDSQGNQSEVETVLAILQRNNNRVGNISVTGIDNDIEARMSKTWRWDCTNNSGACSYRHVINQNDTHSFPASHSYGSIQTDMKEIVVKEENGTYYLHVQTKDAAGAESAVKNVIAYLSVAPLVLTSDELGCRPSKGVGKKMDCTWSGSSDSRYVVNDSATHIFGVNDPYSSTSSVTIDVANAIYNAGTTYYVHVQGKDSDDNLSSIETNFITLTEKTIEVKFDADETKKLNKMSAKWKWECDEKTATADAKDDPNAATKPCVYRYAVTKEETGHDFDNNDGYGITDTVTKTLVHKDENETYYLHVQTKDTNNNVSAVQTSELAADLKFELDLTLKDPKPHTDADGDVTSLQLHLDTTPTFTLRGVLDDHKVTLYSSPECTDGSNDANSKPTKDTRISSEVTMSSGQVDIVISNDKFSDLTTYPIYVGVKESSTDKSIDCYATSSAGDPVIVDDTDTDNDNDIDAVAALFEYTLYNPIAAGADSTCYLSPKGSATCWGNSTPYSSDITPTDNVKAIAINKLNGPCFINGDNTETCRVADTGAVIAIASGEGHDCAILKDNSVECIGSNLEGQLGRGGSSESIVNLGCDRGTKDSSGVCSDDGDELKAKAVATGDKHTCVILLDENKNNSGSDNDNKVLCWGFNAKGQLGQNDTLNHGAEPDNDIKTDDPKAVRTLEPVNLGTGRTAKSITAGQNHTCALLDNNTVKCWGHNILGQLGRNNVIDYGTDSNQMSSLSAISLGRSASSIFTGVGSNHTCAVLNNNTVKCWGNNWKGQLGQNDRTTVDGSEIGEEDDADDGGLFLDGSEITNNRNHGSGTGSDVPLKSGETRSGNINAKSVSSLSAIKFGCNIPMSDRGESVSCTSSNNFKLKTSYSIAVGKDHVCAVLVTDQTADKGKDFVKCWGSNDKKQLGHDEEKNYGSSTDNSVEKAPYVNTYSPPTTTTTQ